MPFRLRSRRTDERRGAPSDAQESLLLRNPDEGKFIAYFPKTKQHPDYWKVSSAAGISRVFPSDTQKVPDSERREGETDARWRRRMLLRDLQALASDPDTLIAAYDGRVPVAYDLVNDFANRLEAAVMAVREGVMSQETWDAANSVATKFREMPDLDDSSRWTAEGLRRTVTWSDVRRLAQEAISVAGDALSPPTPRSM